MVEFVPSKIIEISNEALEAHEEAPVPDNEEISILYNYSRERWNINETVIDDAFAYVIAIQISKENDNDDWHTEPCSIMNVAKERIGQNEKVPST